MNGGFSVTMKVPAIRAISRFEAGGCKTMDEIARCLRSKQAVLAEIDGIVGWTMEGGARVPLSCTLRFELMEIVELTSERTVYKAYSSTTTGLLRVTIYCGEEKLSDSSVIAWSYA